MKTKLPIHFSFGRNWLRYVKYIVTEDIITTSMNSLQRNLGDKFIFEGKTFIDIGCGSGIFSLSAAILGCKKIVSIDVDPQSIEATKFLKEKFAHLIPDEVEWEIKEGSILDDALVEKHTSDADILYSWGVLHHTGNLKLAMENASKLVKPEGIVYISLYNKTEASEWWHTKKVFYNQTNNLMKFILITLYTLFLTFEDIRKGRGLNIYDERRGMHKVIDVIDWLGGLPYEPITIDDTIKFWSQRGFDTIKTVPTRYSDATYPTKQLKKLFVYLKMVGLGCNEYIFQKS